jgi:hypothetical protein
MPLFDPLKFLRLARELAHQSQEEVTLRTAIGRAYYALFLVARGKAGIRGSQNVHSAVIKAVRRRPGYRAVADQLDALRRLRVVADYQLLPQDPNHRDWSQNWATVQVLVQRVLPRLQAW